MGNRNGWGAAKPGKTVTESAKHGYTEPNVKSSRDLKGENSKYQGKTLGKK